MKMGIITIFNADQMLALEAEVLFSSNTVIILFLTTFILLIREKYQKGIIMISGDMRISTYLI